MTLLDSLASTMWGQNRKYLLYHGYMPIYSFPPFPPEKPEMEMKMVSFSGSDSFIGFLDLENVGVESEINRVSITFTGRDIAF
jgi:hypothetical protein